MCLLIKSNRKPKTKIAFWPKICYKLIRYNMKPEYMFEKPAYVLGKKTYATDNTDNQIKEFEINTWNNIFWHIYYGIHSYKKKPLLQAIDNTYFLTVKCKIPFLAKYLYDKDTKQYVSTSIIPKKILNDKFVEDIMNSILKC